MKKQPLSVKTFCIDTLYYLAGSALYALGLYTFALNANYAPGGISGIAIILNSVTQLPLGFLTLMLNIPLALLSWRVLGARFIIKTGYTVLLSTIMLDFVFPLLPTYSGNALMAALFAGVCIGAGLALVYMRGSSTGGTDFLTLSIKKKAPHYSVGQITLVLDFVVVVLGGLVFRNVDAVLYGIISTFATTITMDQVLYGAGGGKVAIVITDKGKAIADAISAEVDRGATLVPAIGAYTGHNKDMLWCACGKSEIYKVRTAAYAIDPAALIMITEATEVTGEGFGQPDAALPPADTERRPNEADFDE